jgi:hypothetical protein
MTTPLSPSDDDIPSWLKEYYSMDPQLRSDFLEAIGMTRDGLKSTIAAYERRRRAARERRSSTDASQAGSVSEHEGNVPSGRKVAVVALRLPKAAERVEFLFDVGAGHGHAGPWQHRSAPPSRGKGATGPGRANAGRRQLGLRGRSDIALVRVVIVLPEK